MDLGTWITVATFVIGGLGLFLAIRQDSRATRVELKADIAEVGSRIARLEDRVEKLDDRVYALAVGLRPQLEEPSTRTTTG